MYDEWERWLLYKKKMNEIAAVMKGSHRPVTNAYPGCLLRVKPSRKFTRKVDVLANNKTTVIHYCMWGNPRVMCFTRRCQEISIRCSTGPIQERILSGVYRFHGCRLMHDKTHVEWMWNVDTASTTSSNRGWYGKRCVEVRYEEDVQGMDFGQHGDIRRTYFRSIIVDIHSRVFFVSASVDVQGSWLNMMKMPIHP